jgi:hypothetical protein
MHVKPTLKPLPENPFPNKWLHLITDSLDLLNVLERACLYEAMAGAGDDSNLALIREVQRRLRTVREEMDDYHVIYGQRGDNVA